MIERGFAQRQPTSLLDRRNSDRPIVAEPRQNDPDGVFTLIFGQRAVVIGVQMLDQHKGHAAIVWHLRKERPERVKPAGRGANADDHIAGPLSVPVVRAIIFQAIARLRLSSRARGCRSFDVPSWSSPAHAHQ